jgi:1,4-alpha-glucan branching enzyme
VLSKRKLKNGQVRVTFTMPALEGSESICLVGDFNDWSETATPMERQADGTWAVKLDLENNRHYHYRYLVNGREWHNDWGADEYSTNPFGSDNSVVVLSDSEKPARGRKKRTAHVEH